MGEPVRELAVVREQERAGRVRIETAHRDDARVVHEHATGLDQLVGAAPGGDSGPREVGVQPHPRILSLVTGSDPVKTHGARPRATGVTVLLRNLDDSSPDPSSKPTPPPTPE